MPSILNSDDGVVSGTSGLKSTGGNDGLLNIQSNGSTIVAVTGSGISVTGTVSQTGVSTFAAGTVSAPSITFTGDTNTGIFSSGADTVNITTGGTERMRIDSSGNLGLGVTPTASNGRTIQFGSNVLLQNVVSTQTMFSYNAIYDGAWKYITANRAAAIRVGSQNEGEISFHYSNAVGTAGGSITNWDANKSMTITQTGQVLVGPTSAQAGGCNFQVSQGITFPATQSASSNANTLDDYEEGNWTPVVAGLTSAGTATYSAQTGRYTKIGNRVFITCDVSWSGHTGTGNMVVTGLPFALNNTDGYVPFSPGETNNIAWTANYSFTPTGGVNSTQVFINQSYVGGSGGSLNTSVDASGGISFSGNYAV